MKVTIDPETLGDSAQDLVCLVRRDGRFEWLGPGWTDLLGWTEEQLRGRPLSELIHPEESEQAVLALQQASEGSTAVQLRNRYRCADGAYRWLAWHSIPTEEGAFLAIARDVSKEADERQQLVELQATLGARTAEVQALTEELEQVSALAYLLQCAQDEQEVGQVLALQMPSLFHGLSGAIYTVTPSRNAVERVAQWGDARQEEVIELADCWALRRGETHRLDEVGLVCTHHRGTPQGAACYLMMAQGQRLGMLVLVCDEDAQDVLEQKDRFAIAVADQIALGVANARLRSDLRVQFTRDPLTGLYNRRFFLEALERELARSALRSEPLTLALIDLDSFKMFNDRYGHQTADVLLQRFARLLEHLCGADEVVARWSGEEFVLLLPDTPVEVGARVIDRLHKALSNLRVHHRGAPCRPVTMSVGLTTYPELGDTATSLLASADAALHTAKESGRNRTVFAFNNAQPREVQNLR